MKNAAGAMATRAQLGRMVVFCKKHGGGVVIRGGMMVTLEVCRTVCVALPFKKAYNIGSTFLFRLLSRA